MATLYNAKGGRSYVHPKTAKWKQSEISSLLGTKNHTFIPMDTEVMVFATNIQPETPTNYEATRYLSMKVRDSKVLKWHNGIVLGDALVIPITELE